MVSAVKLRFIITDRDDQWVTKHATGYPVKQEAVFCEKDSLLTGYLLCQGYLVNYSITSF